MLAKSPIKWRQRPHMTIAVDWDVKHQFKQISQLCDLEVIDFKIMVKFSNNLTFYAIVHQCGDIAGFK